MIHTSQTKLLIFIALFFVLFDNGAFFTHVLKVYPLTLKNSGFLLSLSVGLTSFIVLFFSLITGRHTIKPVLITFLLLASLANYFMNNYNVVIDQTMLQNIMQTDIRESVDLFSAKLLMYLALSGLLPSLFVYSVRLPATSWDQSIMAKGRTIILATMVVLAMVLIFSKFYTSFFREHKPLRYYTNPTYFIYSTGKYLSQNFKSTPLTVQAVGEDAMIPVSDIERELVILVVGEAARADHFSLNGYSRQTNPLLAQEDVISLTNMHSCGTSTAYSVPCMFSIFPRNDFSERKGEANENLLDVLVRAGVHVLWRDNNSDSKGVATRVAFQDYKLPTLNPVCDVECRDEGMLVGLQEYIDEKQDGDILIVLHQMGNHGPAYYKRYPPAFEKFSPACQTNQFDECTKEEINNAYDNALLYTDYFLSQVISLLKQNSAHFETAMIYLGDHGESLGEYGVYLHGLPYSMAPDAQKHVGAFLWFGDRIKEEIGMEGVRQRQHHAYSHDNLFHSLLRIFEVETEVYSKELDIFFRQDPGEDRDGH